MSAAAERLPRGGVVAGVAGTTLVHLVAIGGLVLYALRQPEPMGTVYRVNLVAAPATPAPVSRPTTEAVPRPVERTAPIDPPRRVPRPAPTPTKAPPTTRQETAPETAARERPLAGETPSTGTDLANVSTPGAEFPFPEYLRRIVNEIYRRWQRPVGNQALRAQVRFLILRDGTVREVQISTASRNYSFDIGVLGAVEAAGNARAFGPLPEGFKSDVLQIALWFTPREAR